MRNLDSAWAKLDRANKHLADMRNELGNYESLNPCEFVREDDPVLIKYRISILEPSSTIPAMLGDYVHNLRSALDHTAYALARKPTRQTYFPIFEDRQQALLKRRDPITRRRRRRFNITVNTMPRDAIKILRAIQPYQRGKAAKGDILWLVHELDIADKHRHMTLLAYPQKINLPPPLTGIMYGRGFKDGEEISLHLDAARLLPNEPKFYVPITLAVEIEKGLPILPLPTLQSLYDYIRDDVIPQFARFF